MKMPSFIKNIQQRRARKRYEREKEQRAQQDENAMDRVAEVGRNVGGSIGGV